MFTWWDIDSTPYRRSKCFLLWKHLGNFWRTQKRQTLLDYLPSCFLCEAAHEASCYSVIKKNENEELEYSCAGISICPSSNILRQLFTNFYGIDEGWMAVPFITYRCTGRKSMTYLLAKKKACAVTAPNESCRQKLQKDWWNELCY